MANLKELFPVIAIEGTKKPNAFFLVYNEYNEGRFDMIKNIEPWSILNTEEQAYADLEDLFENLTSKKDLLNREMPHALEEANNKIVIGSRRGVGNVEYGNYVFYHGVSFTDRLATVMKNDISYFVFVNPRAEKYIERFSGIPE